MIKLADYTKNSPVAMRDAYSKAIIEMGKENESIMVVDVDCSHSMASVAFSQTCPDQYLNVGIQEADAVGICAGLSAEGQIPFLNAFGIFATRRAFDQLFLSCGYAHLNAKIIGWDSGVGAEMNGGTHMPLEDVGLMRSIPGFTILEPADPVALEVLLRKSADFYGNVYIRTLRKQAPSVYVEGTDFEIGKSNHLRDGTDVTILAYGLMVSEALKAADILEEAGISVRVIDMFTIKPLDEETVQKAVMETGALVVAENHRTTNGLYSAVTDYTAANCPCPVESVGVDEVFGEVGKMDYLMKTFGITYEDIVKKALAAVARKEQK